MQCYFCGIFFYKFTINLPFDDIYVVTNEILQAEWEEVANRADLLKQENSSLKEELKQLQEKCNSLTSENTTLHVRFVFFCCPTLPIMCSRQ
jgi:FtsZ-binding cell division protein ZapB